MTAADAGHPYVPVFVGGAPRTGTTFLTALLCTSQSCNPFAPEFHYLASLAMALIQNLSIFESSQRHFVRSKQALIDSHFEFMRRVLDESWVSLGSPRYLVIKHCKLTPLFGMLARHIPAARFIVAIRDARDTIASNLRAYEKHHRMRGVPVPEHVASLIAQFNGYYGALLSSQSELQDRLLVVQHERLARGELAPLADFLELSDIDATQLWKRAVFDIRRLEHDSMFSAHWGQPVSAETIDTYRQTLDAATAERIFRETLTVSVGMSTLMPPAAGFEAQRARAAGE